MSFFFCDGDQSLLKRPHLLILADPPSTSKMSRRVPIQPPTNPNCMPRSRSPTPSPTPSPQPSPRPSLVPSSPASLTSRPSLVPSVTISDGVSSPQISPQPSPKLSPKPSPVNSSAGPGQSTLTQIYFLGLFTTKGCCNSGLFFQHCAAHRGKSFCPKYEFSGILLEFNSKYP